MKYSVLAGALGAACFAASAASAQTTDAPAAPAAPAQPPAAAAPAAPAAPAAAAPAAPAISGFGASVIGVIEKACLPMIRGQDPKAVATGAGFKRSRDDYVLQLAGVERITLSPPTTANPTVCTLSVSYQLDQTKALADSLGAWAGAQSPPLAPLGSAYSSSPGMTGWSWTLDDGKTQEGLVFNAQRSADGKPLGKGSDVGTVLFSYRSS
jgi:hypothetical protein